MDDDFDSLAVSVRADSATFRREVDAMRAVLTEDLGRSAESAGRGIESALRKAARNGRLEFEDLGRAAARALGEIASAALKLEGGAGLGGVLAGLGTGLLGTPGRATGGPVAPGRAYVVGERGPELFFPTASGRVEAGGAARGPVQVIVNVSAPGSAGPQFMAQTGRQIAREVRRTLERLDG
jgi:hypothetical protein